LKHLTMKGYRDWGESLLPEIIRFFETSQVIARQGPLGRIERAAEQAYQKILAKGKYTSEDAVRDGILDTTQKKRLFTALSAFPGVHVDKRPQQYGDRKKVYVAWVDDQKLAETEKDPEEKLKQFIKERKPTREQLLQYLGPFPEIAKKKFNKLIDEKKIRLADKYFIWIGKED